MTNTVDNFKWTDELVKEYATYYKVRIAKVGHLPYFVEEQWFKDFKQSKSIPNKQDKSVSVSHIMPHDTFKGNGWDSFFYQFCSSELIQTDKFPAIKQAIEAAINVDTEVPKWYSEDEIYEWLKHKKYSHEIALELAGYWYRDLQGAFKKGWEKAKHELKSEVDTIREEHDDLLGTAICFLRAFVDFTRQGIKPTETSKDAQKIIDYYEANFKSKPSTTPIEFT